MSTTNSRPPYDFQRILFASGEVSHDVTTVYERKIKVGGTFVGCAGQIRIAAPLNPEKPGATWLGYPTLYILAS